MVQIPHCNGGSAPEATGGQAGAGQRASHQLAFLYIFVFWSQFKPSEPFLVNYLVESKGFTDQQVYQDIFPIFVYARFPFNLLVGFLSELSSCGHSGVLTGGAVCGLLTVVVTRFTHALWAQQAVQFAVAAAFASRYAVAAVAFSLTPPLQNQQSIHTVRGVLLLSNCCSALFGEVLRDVAETPLSILFDIDLLSQSLTLFFALLLLAGQWAENREAQAQAQAPVRNEWVEVAEIAEAAAGPTVPGGAEGLLLQVRAALRDLRFHFRVPTVVRWTCWALSMNTAHGLVMTYWQTLWREKGGKRHRDHNGYLLTVMYLAAAMLTLALRSFRMLRGSTSVLAVGSLLSSGFFLWMLAVVPSELQFDCWFLLFTCGFQVMTAVSTFQVGTAVSKACALGEPSCREVPMGMYLSRVPQRARLTLLFSVTGILCSATESIVQVIIGSVWTHVEPRFACLGLCLGVGALLMTVSGSMKALASSWRRETHGQRLIAPASSGQAMNGFATGMGGSVPQVPHLPS